MASHLLLPYYFKKIGWFILIPFLVLGLLHMYLGELFEFSFLTFHQTGKYIFDDGNSLFTLKSNNFTDEFIAIGLITGLVFTAFAKEKIEDEWVDKIRLESLLCFWQLCFCTAIFSGKL